MANTQVTTSHDLTVKKINDDAFKQYTQKLVLKPYMGTSPESIIVVNEDLSKGPGDAVTVPLIGALSGAGVTGEGTMEGNEEGMNFYGYKMTVDQAKNAVRLAGSLTERRTPLDLRKQAAPALTTWLASKVEADAFAAFASISGTVYGSASEATKDSFLAANSDRFLFGATTANIAANDHSAALLNVDTTNDKLSTGIISLAKLMALQTSPLIMPYRMEDGSEWFVMFVHPLAASDLKKDSVWAQAQRDAQIRGSANPLFTGALGAWDGVIVKEAPKAALLTGVGASSANVAVNSLCGMGALGYAQAGYEGGSKVVLTEKKFDYDEQFGVQIKSTYAIGKCQFNGKQHGVVTVYTAAVQP